MSSLSRIATQALLDADGEFVRAQRVMRMGKEMERLFGATSDIESR